MKILRFVFSGIITTQLAFSTAMAGEMDLGFDNDLQIANDLVIASEALNVAGLAYIILKTDSLAKVERKLKGKMDAKERLAYNLEKKYEHTLVWIKDGPSDKLINLEQLNQAANSQNIQIFSRYPQGYGYSESAIMNATNITEAKRVVELLGSHNNTTEIFVKYTDKIPARDLVKIASLRAESLSFDAKIKEVIKMGNVKSAKVGAAGVALMIISLMYLHHERNMTDNEIINK